jgi:hypothetical protein
VFSESKAPSHSLVQPSDEGVWVVEAAENMSSIRTPSDIMLGRSGVPVRTETQHMFGGNLEGRLSPEGTSYWQST